MLRRVLVGDNERVLLIRNKRFGNILAPGEYWIFTLGRSIELERFNIARLDFESAWAGFIVMERPALAERYFTVIETSATHVAAVYADGKLIRVIAPSTRALYWRGVATISYDLIEVGEAPEVPVRLVLALARLGRDSGAGFATAIFATIDEGKRGVVYLDGRLKGELGAGTFGYWNVLATPRIEVLEMRRQTVDVSGREILTKDKVTIRVNVSAVFDIVNATTARSTVKDVSEHLYRTLQIAVRQTLGKRTLEEVLAEKADIDELVSAEVRGEMALFGVRVGAIAIKDIILPGDIREILNQVVTAEKQAQANLIRRREETASTRSLLNTAKLMEDNPLLVRTKELETLEKIADKVEKFTVVGGFDELLSRTVMLRK
jgi:regulator of protease activity HflC (stomatin/prohibitin superfamily)